jgi:prophage endopeptidase
MNPFNFSNAIVFAIGAIIASVFVGIVQESRIDALRLEHMNDQLKQADAQTEALRAAQRRFIVAEARGNHLQSELDAKTDLYLKTYEEKRHAINLLTERRVCLNAPTVRLLNATADSDTAVNLPTAARGIATPSSAIATDTDVAGWIASTQQQYDTCRSRLDALIDWHVPANQPSLP